MNTRPLLSLRLVPLAVIVLLAAGSCALFEPLTRGAGEAEAPDIEESERPTAEPSRHAPPEEAPADDAPTQDTPAEDTPAEEAPPTQGYEVLARGQQSAIRIPLVRAIADPVLWADLWAALTANQADPPERPAVDFDKETVVVLLLGERRTGGYSVRIEHARERRGEVKVVVDVERSAQGEMVTQALTSPYFVATVPVAGASVVFSGDDVEVGFQGD